MKLCRITKNIDTNYVILKIYNDDVIFTPYDVILSFPDDRKFGMPEKVSKVSKTNSFYKISLNKCK